MSVCCKKAAIMLPSRSGLLLLSKMCLQTLAELDFRTNDHI